MEPGGRRNLRRDDLVEPELSYQTVGAVLDVFHKIGPRLKEQTYQRAVAMALLKRGVQFQQQVYCPISYDGINVGRRYFDFLICNKIILELKRGEYFTRHSTEQVLEYLKISGLQLAILANITQTGVHFRRIVNVKTPSGS